MSKENKATVVHKLTSANFPERDTLHPYCATFGGSRQFSNKSALRVGSMHKVNKDTVVHPSLLCHCTSWEQKCEQALGQEVQEAKKPAGLLCSHWPAMLP
jgi:hypothetical protein